MSPERRTDRWQTDTSPVMRQLESPESTSTRSVCGSARVGYPPRHVKRGDRSYVVISQKELQGVIEERGEKFTGAPGGGRDQIAELREEIARIETENKFITEQLEEVKKERDDLLRRLLDTDGGRR